MTQVAIHVVFEWKMRGGHGQDGLLLSMKLSVRIVQVLRSQNLPLQLISTCM